MPLEAIQMNVSIYPEDARKLDRMIAEDSVDTRSLFIRQLIRQEYARRYSQPNPLVTVGEAEAASELKPEETIYPEKGE